MSEFSILGAAADGMDAQRRSLEVAARNLAAAQAAGRGGAFTRLIPVFSVADAGAAAAADADGVPEPPEEPAGNPAGEGDVVVRYVGTRAEAGADPDAVEEMVAILGAQRAFEANASVFENAKRLAERTIDLGRL